MNDPGIVRGLPGGKWLQGADANLRSGDVGRLAIS